MAGLSDDFDDVAISKLRPQRRHSSVDLRADATVADLSVNSVGEIDRSGVSRQGDDFAFRCESVDFFGIEIDLQRAQEIRRILHFLLPLHEMSQPGNSLILAIVRDKFAVFVLPMRRDAFLGNLMHLSCSNLHFEGLTAGYYGSVQRLIHIRPGHRNKIFDPAGDRAPGVVDDAECGVTVLDVVSNNSKGEKIVDLVDRDALLPELQKDRIKPFDARLRKARN